MTRQLEYDTNRDWLHRLTDRFGNKGIFDSTYTYDPNGLLKTEVSHTNQTNLTIEYDTVRRVKSISGTQAQSWSYDPSGNIIFNSVLGYYSYPSQGATACTLPGAPPGPCKQPHAAQSAGRFSLRYDDNGLLSSMTDNNTGGMRSIDWTLDMLPDVVLDFDGTQSSFGYDAFGNRAVETRSQGSVVNETVMHFGSLARKSSLTGFTNIYFAGGRMIGSKTGGNRTWMHYDRNGSVRTITDTNGQIVGRMNYGPFGEAQAAPAQSTSAAKFAGVDIDYGTGLQYMGARFYDPMLNRFISPDTIVPDAFNTQATNRYSYNYNNPLAYTDPSGHQPIDITSFYYGAPLATSGFDFSVRGFSAMPGTILPTVNNISQAATGGSTLVGSRTITDIWAGWKPEYNYGKYQKENMEIFGNFLNKTSEAFISPELFPFALFDAVNYLDKSLVSNAINHGYGTQTDWESIGFLMNVGIPLAQWEHGLMRGVLAIEQEIGAVIESGFLGRFNPFNDMGPNAGGLTNCVRCTASMLEAVAGGKGAGVIPASNYPRRVNGGQIRLALQHIIEDVPGLIVGDPTRHFPGVNPGLTNEGWYIVFTRLQGEGIAEHVLVGSNKNGISIFYDPQVAKGVKMLEPYIAYPISFPR